ncbi:hypothetical protein JIN84_07175 [Luteolibacter yonseiensis]|uniref:Uncharacterized protein n=1 Tax=Luteolibacter yonseiensis TaxID=1144680 RepID=A0A934R578_9BACT|nr:hypothetical protein [Luteolibacter yonseiensis]MBK1815389.1 hypothetical protein [Luteolibacter yonseiensis]
MIHPKDIDGASIAVFIWDQTHSYGGSMVLFGIARFSKGGFFVERESEPLQMPIPESAWENIRENDDRGEGKTFELADYIVMLRLGPLPEDDPPENYERIDLPPLTRQWTSRPT